MAKSKRQPQQRLPLFFLTAARTEYGLSMVGANGLEPPPTFYYRIIQQIGLSVQIGWMDTKGL